MKCPQCNKTVPIIRKLQPKDDAVACVYCKHVIPAELIVWSDGKFHFDVLGDVTSPKCPVKPRVLMREQSIAVLDIPKMRATAIRIINEEPNLRCICQEFYIEDSDIRVELLIEKK